MYITFLFFIISYLQLQIILLPIVVCKLTIVNCVITKKTIVIVLKIFLSNLSYKSFNNFTTILVFEQFNKLFYNCCNSQENSSIIV